MRTKILFISYDGLTDPLGQSQIIPYFINLSKKNYEIHILSTEKSDNFYKRKNTIDKILKENNINWHYINYTKKPAIFSTIFDIYKLNRKASKFHKINKFSIVHCRSYISAFIGLKLKRKYNVKFIFDMRGFYADERVDGNIWDTRKFAFDWIYKYFKKKEKEFILNADYTISLTQSAKTIIRNWEFFQKNNILIEVIPCCADLNTFSKNNIDAKLIQQVKKNNNILEKDYVLSYLGSLGTWYMLDKMLEFFGILKKHKPNAKFLFITNDDTKIVLSKAENLGIEKDSLIFYSAERHEVPSLISISNSSIFFIKPVFSKKASSPTKMAEILAMGVPIICNTGVGDIDNIINETTSGICIKELNDQGYLDAVNKIDSLNNISPEYLRQISENNFSLESGVNLYDSVYKKLI